MNVILNTDEVHALLGIVTSHILDHVELSADGKKQIRGWRSERDAATVGLDEFTVSVNEAIGNFIDERTSRFLRKRGTVRVSSGTGAGA